MSTQLVTTKMPNYAWSAMPEGPITGNFSTIAHAQVLFAAGLIDKSGVVDEVERWRNSDRVATAPGGRPQTIGTRTILVLFLLLSIEHSAQLVSEMAAIPHSRLRPESMEYLGLGGTKSYSGGKRRTRAQWYFLCWRAFHRVVATVDPRPIATTKRGKFPSKEEVEAMRQGWTAEGLVTKHDRLKSFTSRMLEMTWQLVPDEFRENWRGDTCVDASVVPAYARRGAPFGSTHGPIEPTAGWYVRDVNHKIPTDKRKIKKAIFGWDATVVVQTNHDPSTPAGFPQLIAGMGVTVPGQDLIRTARELYEDLARRGHPAGRATGDRGYAPSAKPEDYQVPLRKLGYDIVSDYKIDQLGEDSGAEYEGAIQVEGAWYCPSMPLGLVNATKEFRDGTIDHKTWRLRIVERRAYMFRAKEKPDSKGRVPWMCPARGPGATVLCPLVETCSPNPDELTPILNPPPPARQGKACTNKSSVTIPITAGAKHAQAMQYASPEWQTVYSSDRNTIEGMNGFFKDSSKEAVADAGRRRVRGFAAAQLSLCFLFVTVNLRKIEKFRDEYVNHSPEERVLRAERKLAVRDNRKSRKDRMSPWDDFSKRPGYKETADPPDAVQT
jgi:hypothetical protein